MESLGKVDYYTHFKGEITVHFPNGKALCQYCPYIKEEFGLKRFLCLLTYEFVLNPFAGRGRECPLKEETA